MFLIVNTGSTSVKTRLFDGALRQLAAIHAEYGGPQVLVEGVDGQGRPFRHALAAGDAASGAQEALAAVFAQWLRLLDGHGWPLAAIGHRVVHGGHFARAVVVDEALMAELAALDAHAPLHNPLNRLGIALAARQFPGVRQCAAFDTAFHRSLPAHAAHYALPGQLAREFGFYRYGFHGLSCQYSVSAAARLLGRPAHALNLVILHLGGGASATAVRGGVSVDTSMGFSPSEGLVMATRCGDLDPAIILALQKAGWPPDDIDQLLNRRGGLKGLAGDGDMRRVLARAGHGDADAGLALAVYCHRVKKYLGAYQAVLGAVDAVVFTGGVGAHAAPVRSQVLAGLEPMGMGLDEQANARQDPKDRDIAAPGARTRVLVVHADEEHEIARQMLELLAGRPPCHAH